MDDSPQPEPASPDIAPIQHTENPAIRLALVSTGPQLQAEPDEIKDVLDPLRANPADGRVTLRNDQNGKLIAEWTSGGQPVSVGPNIKGKLKLP